MEVALRIGEGSGAKLHEAVHVPLLNMLGLGVHIDGEVEEIAERRTHSAVLAVPGRLQHIEPFQDQHVRATHHHLIVGDDVISKMRVLRGPDFRAAGLDLRHKAQQPTAVISLREAFSLHQPTALQLSIGVEESIGGHQFHPRSRRPAPQHLLQHARSSGLAHSHRTSHADHKRRTPRGLTQELIGLGPQMCCGLHIDVQ